MPDVRFLLFAPETEEHLTRASPDELRQLLANAHVTAANPAGPNASTGIARHLLIGRTDGGRALTVVIEATLYPTTWLPVTAWEASPAERRLLERAR
ncbi:MAG: hypothetical protein MSC31_07660 [Solirubrobacteraceae bacterium MAG38_C4-C5]|nr:hypothetical protein [Candidatus Siliceabacter maunaloa]